jgi:LuxR family maltose regulon positive regulatory protein
MEQRRDGEGMIVVTSLNRQTLDGLSKCTMPCMSSSQPRPRIFARLDQMKSVAVVWVSAPAGYGKTTAVSNYLRARHRPTAWYQCDEGDGDIASFFHYMTLARHQLSHSELIPVFHPQYLSAAQSFCRNYFRAWFAGLSEGGTLVLDNWQDVPAPSELRALLPIIAEQLPQGSQIFIISRSDPDASVSRLIVGERLAQLSVEDLQLSRSETEAIALSQIRNASIPLPDIDALHLKTQGWIAAVTLLLRHRDIASIAARSGPCGAPQAIFDYFAIEVFERLDSGIQQFLMSLAWLEHIAVSVARRASGREDAGTLLDTLVRQNAFTSYRAVSDSYHFHPLFRVFLQRRLDEKYTFTQRRELLLTAARALSTEGESEAGINLTMQAQSWQEVADLVHGIASAFVDQGRVTTLARWIDTLPTSVLENNPWLIYWRGVCRITLDFPLARADLELSYHRFVAADDRTGQSLACAAMLQHIAYTYLDYREMLAWVGRLELLLQDAHFVDSRIELKVRAAYMLAVSQSMPNHPQLFDSVAQVARLVSLESDLISSAEAVSSLLHFYSRFGRTPQYGELDNIVAKLLDNPALPPLHRLNLLWLHAYQLHSSGEPARVVAILRDARALARHEGLFSEDTRMRLCELQAQEPGRGSSAMLATFSELEPHVRSMPAIPLAHFLYVRSIFELGCGNLEQALKYGEEALPLIRTSHWYIGQALASTGLAEVYCAVGRYDDAAHCLQECEAITANVIAPLVEFNVQLIRAELARCRRDAAELKSALTRAFSIGREQGYANGFHTSSQLLRRLIPRGIELGIEPSYCRWVIAKRRFAPTSEYQSSWPWPVKIRATGRLRIFLQDEEQMIKGKAQRKPLEVLKLLAAYPNGMESSRIMDELWGDLDGDAARNALDLAVHRLRKILKDKDAVRLANGNLSLNKDIVWMDTAALERIFSVPLATLTSSDDREELLELYRGSLLGDEQWGVMIAVARERLRRNFAQRALKVANVLEGARRWEEATSWYLRVTEREPADESLQHGLLQALRSHERDACEHSPERPNLLVG